jgi:transposase
MSPAVARGRARKVAMPIPYIGVDEKAFRKGHRYHTIVCDLERSTVEFVTEERRTQSLAAYYRALTDAQRDGLKAVAMDMWEPYIQATRTGLPDGDQRIVFDRVCATAHTLSYGAPVVMCPESAPTADWHGRYGEFGPALGT